MIEQIQARKDWIGVEWAEETSSSEAETSTTTTTVTPKRSVRLLDYACGTGLVSRALLPFITQAVGIDLSSGMVDVYNQTAANQGLAPEEMRAVVGNLVPSSGNGPQGEISGEEFWEFDIAAVGLGFHHFEKPALAAKRLGERLKKGGTLLIIDFLPHGLTGHGQGHGQESAAKHDGHAHRHGSTDGDAAQEDPEQEKKTQATVLHNGFSEQQMKTMFEDAGVGEGFEFVSLGNAVVFSKLKENGEDMKRTVFMARGRKS